MNINIAEIFILYFMIAKKSKDSLRVFIHIDKINNPCIITETQTVKCSPV